MGQEKHHPVASILDHGIIRSVGDFTRLGIVDWTRYKSHWQSPQHAMEIVSSHFTNRMSFLIARLNLYEYPERDDFPGWEHAGGHEELGRLYWNHFHYVFEGELRFHDRPDFSGVIIHRNRNPSECLFWGDIGLVSPITILDTVRALRPYTMWISVQDAQTQVILEPLLPANSVHTAIQKLLSPHNVQWHTFETSVFIECGGKNVYLGEIAEIARITPLQAQGRVRFVLSRQRTNT